MCEKRIEIMGKGSNMGTKLEPDFEFRILISERFQKTMEKIRDQQLRTRIYECMSVLARGFQEWKRLNAKKIDVGDSSRCVRSVRTNGQMRMVFEGPVQTKRFGCILFIHDVCRDEEFNQTIRRIVGAELNKREFREIGITTKEMMQRSKGLESSMTAFSKPIPVKVLLSPERMDAILSSAKSNLLLTQGEMEALGADCPLLIHGQAGSGKTTLLCHRLALSVLSRRSQRPPASFVFLSYNDKLVTQARTDTKEILRDQHGVSGSLEGVEFTAFQTFLKSYVPNPSRFKTDNYVRFGRFKRYFEIYRRGNPAARKIPAEVAWHGIRSILKGACIPPSRPPLSHEAYEHLARRRRDFPQDMFSDIYRIGEWYQREVIQDKELWDDQDLAWASLDWVLAEKERNPKMSLYDEIFCDECQDLTEIEFRLLIALCKQPMSGTREGLSIVFAGDHLQTINPTGFRWSVVRSEVYRVQGKPVRLHELQENFRSDKKIVMFANHIQEVRSRYVREPIAVQEAFERDGDIPRIVTVDTEDEISAVEEKLGELPPESAVIVWPEERDEVSRLYETERALSSVDEQLDVYSISEAKGLEFRFVVLYKFGSSPEALKWKKYLDLAGKQTPSLEDEIPLLYFLNRLYVAVTRAKSFLFIVDTSSGIDNLWRIWKDTLYFSPRAEIRRLLEHHPAFLGDVSDAAWRRWAETLFEHAETTGDLRLYERARRSYEKANETQNIRRIDARLMEIDEQWEKAGKLYFEMHEFERSGHCYERAEKWNKAYDAYAMLPTAPKTKRSMAICKFREDKRGGAEGFYEYALTDDTLEKKYLDELGAVFSQTGENRRAADVFLRIARKFDDNAARIQAAISFFKVSDFEDAEKLFRDAGENKRSEYQLSRAENLLRKKDLHQAARLFFDNDAPKKVVEIYESIQQEKETPLTISLLELAAESYFKLAEYEKALKTYHALGSDPGTVDHAKIWQRIAECLERLNQKPAALEYYRKAQLYDEAARLAEELDRPREEVLSLRFTDALGKHSFEKAAKLAEDLGDEKRAHVLKGHLYKYRKQYCEAIPEFAKGEEWSEALDCVALAQAVGLTSYDEQYIQWCSILLAVVKSHKSLTLEENEQLMPIVLRVIEDPLWEKHISPPVMGLAFEKCTRFALAANYYETKIHEPWAQEGWLRVKSAHRDFYQRLGQLEKAERIEEEIRQRQKMWSHD